MRKTVISCVAVLGFGVLVLALQAPSSAPILAAGGSGQSLYLTNCSGCHGVNGQGAVNIAPPLAGNPYVTGDAKKAISAAIGGMIGPVNEHGTTWNGSMPSWRGTLSNAQLAAIISYVRSSWGNKASAVTPSQVAAVAGSASAPAPPVSDAALIYATNCSGCHGASGQGAVNIAPPLAKNAYVVGNPNNVIRTVLGGLVGPVKEHGATWNGSMPGWQGTLSNAQIAAVISYIRGSWGNNAKRVTAQEVAASR